MLKKKIEEKMNRIYQSEIGELFTEKWDWNSYRYQERFSLVFALVEKHVPKRAQIIDIGCAQGNFSSGLAALGYNVLGLDIRRKILRYAKWKSNKLKIDSRYINFIVGSTLNLPIADNTYDCILFLEIIEHLNSPEKALKELKRILKKDGILILSTVNNIGLLGRKSFSQFKRNLREEIKGNTFSGKEHLFEMNKSECISLLSLLGFRILEIRMIAPLFLYPILLINKLKPLPRSILRHVTELFSKIKRFCRGIMIVATKAN